MVTLDQDLESWDEDGYSGGGRACQFLPKSDPGDAFELESLRRGRGSVPLFGDHF